MLLICVHVIYNTHIYVIYIIYTHILYVYIYIYTHTHTHMQTHSQAYTNAPWDAFVFCDGFGIRGRTKTVWFLVRLLHPPYLMRPLHSWSSWEARVLIQDPFSLSGQPYPPPSSSTLRWLLFTTPSKQHGIRFPVTVSGETDYEIKICTRARTASAHL